MLNPTHHAHADRYHGAYPCEPRRLAALCLLIKLAILAFAPRAAAQQPYLLPIDCAVITATPWDIGHPLNVFDGDPNTLYRSANINPAFIQVVFPGIATLHEFKVLFSIDLHQWMVETAMSVEDMDSQEGSYTVAVPWTPATDGQWASYALPKPLEARVVRLQVERLTGDNYVHIYEWEIIGTLIVDQEPPVVHVPQDFPTIQQAIDNIGCGEVVVAPGTYNEAINFNGKPIHLRSSHGPDVTVLDATGLGTNAVRTTSAANRTTVLDGFTITGGGGWGGASVFLRGTPIVTNCRFTNNLRAMMVGSNPAHPTIEQCDFTNNFEGIVADSGSVTVHNSTFLENGIGLSLGTGVGYVGDCVFANHNVSAVFVIAYAVLTVERSLFIGNYGGYVGVGAAISVYLGHIQATDCHFEDNHADFGGAVGEWGGYSVTTYAFTRCTFVNNSAEADGGAIYYSGFGDSDSFVAHECMFEDNSANHGAAILASNATLSGCEFRNNVSEGSGSTSVSTLLGEGVIGDGVTIFSRLVLGPGPARAIVSGDYSQSFQDFGEACTLGIELGGLVPETEHDILEVTGTATLAGLLDVSLINDFKPSLGDAFAILTAAAIINPFDIAYFPQMPPGLVMRVNYNHGVAANASVTLTVEELAMLLGFGGASSIGLDGAATAIAVGDFDGDDALDIAITLRGETPADPGSVLVLFNAGDGETFTGVQYAVGREPSAIAVADLTGNDSPDIAITNAGDNNVSILLNDGSGDFALPVNVNVGAAPSGIVAADLTANGEIDLAVSNAGSDNVTILHNTGGAFAFAQSINVGSNPQGIAAGDLTGVDGVDLVVANFDDNTISLLNNNGDGTFFPAGAMNVGNGPKFAIIDDLDQDKDLDIITGNTISGTVSVLVQTGGAGPGGFAPAVDLPLNGQPLSMTAFDMNASGVPDLAIVVDDADLGLIVRILRNDFDPDSGQLIFTHADDLGEGESPVLVTNGDVTGDGFDDLITINAPPQEASAGGGPESSLSIRPNLLGGPPTNPADLNGDNAVDVLDLLILLDYWGACPGKGQPCPADFNGDGSVDVLDLLFLLDNWG